MLRATSKTGMSDYNVSKDHHGSDANVDIATLSKARQRYVPLDVYGHLSTPLFELRGVHTEAQFCNLHLHRVTRVPDSHTQ